jgi:hypothetical protein
MAGNTTKKRLLYCTLSMYVIQKTIHQKIMWKFFPSNLSRLQNNLPKNNVEPVHAKSQITRLRFGREKIHIIQEIDPKTIRLSCLQNNPPENNVKPVLFTIFYLNRKFSIFLQNGCYYKAVENLDIFEKHLCTKRKFGFNKKIRTKLTFPPHNCIVH